MYTFFFFISSHVAKGLTLKRLLQKNFVELYFFKITFTEAKFLYNCFWHNLIVYNI